MTRSKKDNNKEILIFAVIGIAIYLLSKKAVGGGKTIDVTSDFVIEAYRDLITTEADMTYQGVPLHIYLARNTSNYDAVKRSYNSTYGGDFTSELTSRLAGQKLADYVAELFKNGELISA